LDETNEKENETRPRPGWIGGLMTRINKRIAEDGVKGWNSRLKTYTELKSRKPMKRTSSKYAGVAVHDNRWKRECLHRDYGKCKICGGTAIEVHHILGKQAYPQYRHILENGVSVCRVCHCWIHNEGRGEFDEKFSATLLKIELLNGRGTFIE